MFFRAIIDKGLGDCGDGFTFREFKLRVLERHDRFAERLAVFDVSDGFINRRFHLRDALDGDVQALLRQLFHQLDKTMPCLRAKQRIGRDFHIIKKQLGGVLGVHADFI